MSALLKSGAGEAVRPFGSVPAPGIVEVVPDPRDLECARLRSELVALQERLAANEAAAAEAVDAAREEGRRRGHDEAGTREAERLAALREGIERAATAWTARLDAWDGLAAALAGAALARLFERHADWHEQVVRMLARQLGALRREAIVAVHVSPDDFAGPEALDALREAVAPGEPLALAIDRTLESGTCRIDCRFEQIDLDLRANRDRLAGMLAEMAVEGEA